LDVDSQEALPDGSQLAAIDLGSNSFHLIIVKIEHGEMRTVEALAEKVQLGAGLENDMLSEEAIQRGLDCLSRFAQLLESVGPERVRVVGTHALRLAKNRRAFTVPAKRILGSRVDVIYGLEEARLVYLGVAHSLADDAQSRQRFEPQFLESLQMGCVSFGHAFFPDGRISRGNYRRAYEQAREQIYPIRHRFGSKRWEECVGSSGTLQALETILTQNGWEEGGISRRGLTALEKRLLKFKSMEEIQLDGLTAPRRGVILPGLAIASRGALREGVIYDLMGRLSHEDVRERTVNALMQRYAVDAETADIFERRARTFYMATRESWQLTPYDWDLLHWLTRTHEIGMAIAHKHFNRHSAYVLRNADLPGFSQEEQEVLAVLALGQRGKLKPDFFADIAETELLRILYMLAIIRLAGCFKHVEVLEQLPDFSICADEQSLTLAFPEGWLDDHPLTERELGEEKQVLGKLGLKLKII
jgi:exopolyphosphatase/guanosine-5'-triphosphate,3'-diphosphate pyrophosphatase